MGILQTRILEWVVISSSRGSSQPRNQTHVSYVSCMAGRFFTTGASWETYIYICKYIQWASLIAQLVKNLPAKQEKFSKTMQPRKSVIVSCAIQ